VSGGLSDPFDVGKPLDDKLVGVYSTEYGQIGTATSKEESWTTTFFKDALVLQVVSIEA